MKEPVFDSLLVRTMLPVMLCVLQLFAAYVLLHGHYSPGGGFQAGVLLGGSLILPTLLDRHHRRYMMVGPRVALAMSAVGVLIYALFAIQPLLVGAPMLDYAQLPLATEVADRRSLGILGIEVGVTFGVAGAVVSIYHTLGFSTGDGRGA